MNMGLNKNKSNRSSALTGDLSPVRRSRGSSSSSSSESCSGAGGSHFRVPPEALELEPCKTVDHLLASGSRLPIGIVGPER